MKKEKSSIKLCSLHLIAPNQRFEKHIMHICRDIASQFDDKDFLTPQQLKKENKAKRNAEKVAAGLLIPDPSCPSQLNTP